MDLTPLAGLPMAALESPATTTFENIYTGGGRLQYLRAQALPLTAEAVPTNWLRAPIVHLGPLDREVDYALAAAFSGAMRSFTLAPASSPAAPIQSGQLQRPLLNSRSSFCKASSPLSRLSAIFPPAAWVCSM